MFKRTSLYKYTIQYNKTVRENNYIILIFTHDLIYFFRFKMNVVLAFVHKLRNKMK